MPAGVCPAAGNTFQLQFAAVKLYETEKYLPSGINRFSTICIYNAHIYESDGCRLFPPNTSDSQLEQFYTVALNFKNAFCISELWSTKHPAPNDSSHSYVHETLESFQLVGVSRCWCEGCNLNWDGQEGHRAPLVPLRKHNGDGLHAGPACWSRMLQACTEHKSQSAVINTVHLWLHLRTPDCKIEGSLRWQTVWVVNRAERHSLFYKSKH